MKINGSYEIMTLMNETIAVDVSNKFHGVIKLNKTSEEIWKGIEQGKSVEKIASQLTEKYDVSHEKALESVNMFCSKLTKEGILIK